LKRRIALFALVALVAAPQMFAGGTWLKTVAEAQKVAKAKNQLILVDMFAQWCGWCHRFEREVFPSQVFQNATADMVLLRLDTEDRGEGTKMSQKYGVTSLPTFLLLAPDLSVAGMIRGYAPPNDFVKSLKETREKYNEFQKRVKNEGQIAKDPIARLALAKEFLMRSSYDQAVPRLKKLMTEKGIPISVRDEAYYQLALVQTVQNKYADAQKTIRELVSLSKIGESVERARVLNGEIYVQQGNYLGAANEFRSFKQTFPNSPLIPRVDMMLPGIEKKLSSGK
jgi:thioredoxin-related protein